MKKITFLLFFSFILHVFGQSVFINEFHYDNQGADIGEFVEIAGPTGTDLSGYSIVLYNGNGGAPYDTENISGIIPNLENGYGVLSFSIRPIQNGAPDGIALFDGSSVVQFLSYEGVINAVSGVAEGLTSVDIMVSENGSTPVGHSLQLTGEGSDLSDFTWQSPLAESPGALNTGQTIIAPVLSISDEDYNTLESIIYPNPVDVGKNINVITKSNSSIDVEVYSLTGQKMLGTSINSKTLSVDFLSTGIYLVKLVQDEKTAVTRLVIN